MSFYALPMAWLFTLIAPAVLLYFLKLKRPRLAVPSLTLWRQVLADSRVNSPFQRFKRNLLLLLQLLLLCLLILAAMQPYLRGGDADAQRLLVLLDRSASMAALDKAGGESRLEEAKRILRERVEQMGMGEEISVITFAATARQAVPFTSSKRQLIDAIDAVTVEDVGSDLGDALRVAEAVYRTTRVERVILLTDGNVPGSVDFDLPFKDFRYQKTAPAGANLGITALTAQRSPGEGWRVFVKVEGTKGANIPAVLELLLDGELRGEQRVILDASGERRLVFPVQADGAVSLELRLKPEGFDALATDNGAFLELTNPRDLKVYVSPTLASYRHAMSGMKGLDLYPREGADAQVRYDLSVTDAVDAAPIDAAIAFHVDRMPAELAPFLEKVAEPSAIIDWRRGTPLLDHVDLGEVSVMDHARWVNEAGEEELEKNNFEALVYGPSGPLVLQRVTPGRTEFFALFHTDRSTLPYRLGFPILVQNLTERLAMHGAGLLEVTGLRAGALPPIALGANQTFRVEGPGGIVHEGAADAAGVGLAISAPRVGVYTVSSGGSQTQRHAVSLLRPEESTLVVTDELKMSEMTVAAASAQVDTSRSIWAPLAWLALLMLAFEWWYYQRRPGGWA